jgi:hypothetical protein
MTVSAEALEPDFPLQDERMLDTGAPAANAASVAALALCKNSLLFHDVFIFDCNV